MRCKTLKRVDGRNGLVNGDRENNDCSNSWLYRLLLSPGTEALIGQFSAICKREREKDWDFRIFWDQMIGVLDRGILGCNSCHISTLLYREYLSQLIRGQSTTLYFGNISSTTVTSIHCLSPFQHLKMTWSSWNKIMHHQWMSCLKCEQK